MIFQRPDDPQCRVLQDMRIDKDKDGNGLTSVRNFKIRILFALEVIPPCSQISPVLLGMHFVGRNSQGRNEVNCGQRLFRISRRAPLSSELDNGNNLCTD